MQHGMIAASADDSRRLQKAVDAGWGRAQIRGQTIQFLDFGGDTDEFGESMGEEDRDHSMAEIKERHASLFTSKKYNMW